MMVIIAVGAIAALDLVYLPKLWKSKSETALGAALLAEAALLIFLIAWTR